MRRSLQGTWAAIALAAFAVLTVAGVVGRDFVADAYPECPGSLIEGEIPMVVGADEPAPAPGTAASPRLLLKIPLEPGVEQVDLDAPGATPVGGRPSFQLLSDPVPDRLFDEPVTRYDDTRVVWKQRGLDGRSCTCGSISLVGLGSVHTKPAPETAPGVPARPLRLLYMPAADTYVVVQKALPDGWPSAHATFRLTHDGARHLQRDRVLARPRLPGVVALFAIAALAGALLRSRGISRALRVRTWIEARLTPEGLVETASGTPLGTLEPPATPGIAPGPVVVAPDALRSGTLYRDMPVIGRGSIAEGTLAHLRDVATARERAARVLAVLSIACSMLAFGARLMIAMG